MQCLVYKKSLGCSSSPTFIKCCSHILDVAWIQAVSLWFFSFHFCMLAPVAALPFVQISERIEQDRPVCHHGRGTRDYQSSTSLAIPPSSLATYCSSKSITEYLYLLYRLGAGGMVCRNLASNDRCGCIRPISRRLNIYIGQFLTLTYQFYFRTNNLSQCSI